MLARGTLAAAAGQKIFERGATAPGEIRWKNKSGGAANIVVYAGPDGDTEIDQGTIGAGEPAVTDLRGVLAVGEVVTVDCDVGDAVDFCVTED